MKDVDGVIDLRNSAKKSILSVKSFLHPEAPNVKMTLHLV